MLKRAMEEVVVLSDRYVATIVATGDLLNRGLADQNFDNDRDETVLAAGSSHPPAEIHEDNLVEGKTQPQVTVARKTLGTLKVSESSVTAGSMVDLED